MTDVAGLVTPSHAQAGAKQQPLRHRRRLPLVISAVCVLSFAVVSPSNADCADPEVDVTTSTRLRAGEGLRLSGRNWFGSCGEVDSGGCSGSQAQKRPVAEVILTVHPTKSSSKSQSRILVRETVPVEADGTFKTLIALPANAGGEFEIEAAYGTTPGVDRLVSNPQFTLLP
jgi:hypothetical protein